MSTASAATWAACCASTSPPARSSEYPWTDDDRRRYLGGKIMAARILADTLADGTDPLGPENVVVISTGPLTGSGAPSTSRFNVSSLSPLTGIVAASNCGGPFGTYLKKAGLDALVITGAGERARLARDRRRRA